MCSQLNLAHPPLIQQLANSENGKKRSDSKTSLSVSLSLKTRLPGAIMRYHINSRMRFCPPDGSDG